MIEIVYIKDRKLVDSSVLSSLPRHISDGKYLLTLKWVNQEKSIRDWQSEYFAMVDDCVRHTGMKRYDIHELFKVDQEITSTKNFNVNDWAKFIEAFKWYAYNNMDVLV